MANKAQGNTCWMCGEKGEPDAGSRLWCKICDVKWFPIGSPPAKLNTKIVWHGFVVDVIDFTKPGAPGCPA